MDYTVHGILQARILEWVAFPFYRESSQPRDRNQVFHTAGGFFFPFFFFFFLFVVDFVIRCNETAMGLHVFPNPADFFTSWATREAQDLPDPGIEPGFPALQMDSLQTELLGKSKFKVSRIFKKITKMRGEINKIENKESVEDRLKNRWFFKKINETDKAKKRDKLILSRITKIP